MPLPKRRDEVIQIAKEHAQPLQIPGPSHQFSRLLDAVGDAQVVMIGEASHGTHEFYHTRAEITKLLIEQKGFNIVAVEGDWPDCYRINKYVRGGNETPMEALKDFTRFPRWMWRNDVVLDFMQWLRTRNESVQDTKKKAGFYGLDLYSLFTSAHEVIQYLMKVDTEAAKRAMARYACFDRYSNDTQKYGYAASFGMSKSCQDGVVKQLQEMMKMKLDQMDKSGYVNGDSLFCAQMNAQVVRDAEEYYRGMFTRDDTWNLRDTHMCNTLDALIKHQSTPDQPARAVVWAHNSHLGDASQTSMGEERGELNIGQVVRERYGKEHSYNVGFTTYTGTVTAASNWGENPRTKKVVPGKANAYEGMFHAVGEPAFLVITRTNNPKIQVPMGLTDALRNPQLERAIGVIYRPDTELLSHYFEASLAKQFDSVIHIDVTTALRPLDEEAEVETEKIVFGRE